MLRRILVIVTLPVVISGCDARAERDAPAAVIDTLPNGAVRVRGPADGRWTSATRWRLEPVARIGAVDGDGADVFGQIWAITLDDADRIYVLDRQAKDVRVFDAGGNHVRTLGREGAGPGEFSDPWGFAWDTDGRLWVTDVRNRRYSVFDTAGAHVREYPRLAGGFSVPWPGRIARDGMLYEPSFSTGLRAIIAFRPGDELVGADTFPQALLDHAPADAPASAWELRDARGLPSFVGIPFAPRADWALDADAHMWVGYSGAYTLVYRTLQGDTLRVLQRDVTPIPVTAAEHDAAIGGIAEQYRSHPQMDLARIPHTKPYFERLLPDDAGYLWVLRAGEERAWFFDVFDADGFLGTLSLPYRPSPFPPPRIGRNLLATVTHDSLGVASVVAYRIIRTGATR